MKNHYKIAVLALALAAGTGGSFLLAQTTTTPGPTVTPTAATGARAGERRGGRGGQPHMEAALINLQEARRQIDQAAHDKGGYREKALASVDQAIKDVQDGIEYARQHPEEFRGGRAGERRGGAGTVVPPAGP